MTVSLLGMATACQTDESGRENPGASAREVVGGPGSEGPDYEGWRPSYREVRPATADDVQTLRQRAIDLNETSYTVTVPSMGLQIASAPDHVRVRWGEGYPEGFDLHLDPAVAIDDLEDLFGGPFVMCLADSSCVELGGEGEGSDGPHMVNNGVDTIVFTATSIVASQRALPEGLEDISLEEASFATVDSPSGTLDCLVSGGTPEDHARLEGSPVEAADPVYRDDGPEPLSTTCVDEHGLAVVALPSLLGGVVPYGTFEQEVPDGFDDHADPQPRGTTPATTPSQAPATSDEPGGMESVLVAGAPISAGESLTYAQQTGSLDLEFVPTDEVLPGALSSTEGIDGVALQDLAVGEQLTEDSFGFPTTEDLAALGVTPALYDDLRRRAARHGYGPRAGVPPDDAAMLALAHRLAHRCRAVTSGATSWGQAASDDSSQLTPNFDQALRLNAYLEKKWCPKVEHG